jgi:pimeloyl-ACP methyl ester carboxylesterase
MPRTATIADLHEQLLQRLALLADQPTDPGDDLQDQAFAELDHILEPNRRGADLVSGAAQFILDGDGMIRGSNPAAARYLSGRGPVFVPPPPEARPGPVLVLVTQDEGEHRIAPFVALWIERFNRWIMTEARNLPDASLLSALGRCYGLTPAESATAKGMMQGLTAEAMALDTGLKTSTLRQRLKAVMAKLGVHSQAEAVAQLAALERVWMGKRRMALSPPRAEAASTKLWVAGQPCGVQRFGAMGGIPVLMFHGALFGISLPPGLADMALHLNLDVIAPERPGYGATALADPRRAVEQSVAFGLAALDGAGIGRAVVLGQDVGTVYAAAFARAHPERAAGIVAGPATPPMRGWAQTAHMPTLHRVSAFATQKMPALMDRIIWMGLKRIAEEGPAVIPGLVFADSTHDREVMARPENLSALEGLHGFVMSQSATGLLQDMHVTNLDWSGWLPRLRLPVLMLHGELSQTVSASAVAETVAGLDRGQLVIVPKAGHTLPWSQPELILRHVARMGTALNLDPEVPLPRTT